MLLKKLSTAQSIKQLSDFVVELVSPDGTRTVPIKLMFLDEQWKINSIGSDEELQDLLKLEE